MSSNHERRMRLLEVHSATVERRSLAGLVRTDTELERIVAGLPGAAGFDVRYLSDDELNAIIDG